MTVRPPDDDTERQRRDSWDRFRAAVAALQQGDREAVAEYLRQLERKHGREFAEQQREQLRRCAKAWRLGPDGQPLP